LKLFRLNRKGKEKGYCAYGPSLPWLSGRPS
jgi:hypothetical protein